MVGRRFCQKICRGLGKVHLHLDSARSRSDRRHVAESLRAGSIIASMKYAAIVAYTPDASTIAKARPAHREYLTGLVEQGKLVISGPFADDSGAILVYETGSPEQVKTLIVEDPFAIH